MDMIDAIQNFSSVLSTAIAWGIGWRWEGL